MKTVIQSVTKRLDDIHDHDLKIKTVTEIMNICERIIAQDKIEKKTKYYKTLLESFKFNENKSLATLTSNLYVIKYSREELNDNVNITTNIMFDDFKILMSNRIKRHTDDPEYVLCNDSIKQEIDIKSKWGINTFYTKLKLKNVSLKEFVDYITTICYIFNGKYD